MSLGVRASLHDPASPHERDRLTERRSPGITPYTNGKRDPIGVHGLQPTVPISSPPLEPRYTPWDREDSAGIRIGNPRSDHARDCPDAVSGSTAGAQLGLGSAGLSVFIGAGQVDH
jgi:hypothetical protein